MTLEPSYLTAIDILKKDKAMRAEFPLHEVKTLPKFFYCEWLPEEFSDYNGQIIYKKDVVKHCQCRDNLSCFNHRVGMPTLKFEDDTDYIETKLWGYQKRNISMMENNAYYAENKCRGAGETELKIVRYDSWKYSLTTSPGRKALIIAGINQDMAIMFLHRAKMLLDKMPEAYLFKPKTDFPTEIFFAQGGSMWALPSNPNAVRSLENVGDVDYDESHHWSRIDDAPVFLAGEPHVVKSRAHVNQLSTPAGKQKFFWDKIFDPECQPATKYAKRVLNWREVVGIPEPDPLVLEDIDIFHKVELDNIYRKRYEKDIKYRHWFNQMFPGLTMEDILEVQTPILDIKEIVRLYKTDRNNYDQEFDNQFILADNRAFGDFDMANIASENFDDFVTL